MGDFMKQEVTGRLNRPIFWPKGSGKHVQDTATASFSEFGSRALSYGSPGVCGCTLLVIVSRRGVYIAHYWESVSFAPDQEWIDQFGGEDEAFQKTVLDGIQKGVATDAVPPQQVSLKGVASAIDDDSIRAYLIIPIMTDRDVVDGYRPKWDQMKRAVEEILPSVTNRWREIRYDAVEPEKATGGKGYVLFKYDPNHNGRRKTTMWVEDNATPEHDDEWLFQ